MDIWLLTSKKQLAPHGQNGQEKIKNGETWEDSILDQIQLRLRTDRRSSFFIYYSHLCVRFAHRRLAHSLVLRSLYYNQALGLNINLVGWALGLAIFSAAISAPIVGAFSDQFRSRWGRRHPFLFASAVPLALSLYFLFSPPEFLRTVKAGTGLPPQVPLFIWMVVWNVLAQFFLAVYLVPSVALAAELSSDYNERTSIFSFQSMFGYAFGTSLSYLAWQMMAGTSRRAYDGETVPRHLDAANYPPLIILGCCSVLLGIFIRTFGTRKEISHLDQASDDMPHFSLFVVVKDIYQTWQNRNYLFLLLAGTSPGLMIDDCRLLIEKILPIINRQSTIQGPFWLVVLP